MADRASFAEAKADRDSVLRAAEVVADLEDDKVPADEHVVEIVRVDPEQDRGHSSVDLKIQNWFYKKSKGRQCKGRRPRNFDFFS